MNEPVNNEAWSWRHHCEQADLYWLARPRAGGGLWQSGPFSNLSCRFPNRPLIQRESVQWRWMGQSPLLAAFFEHGLTEGEQAWARSCSASNWVFEVMAAGFGLVGQSSRAAARFGVLVDMLEQELKDGGVHMGQAFPSKQPFFALEAARLFGKSKSGDIAGAASMLKGFHANLDEASAVKSLKSGGYMYEVEPRESLDKGCAGRELEALLATLGVREHFNLGHECYADDEHELCAGIRAAREAMELENEVFLAAGEDKRKRTL